MAWFRWLLVRWYSRWLGHLRGGLGLVAALLSLIRWLLAHWYSRWLGHLRGGLAWLLRSFP